MVRYFAIGENTRRELQASSVGEALSLLQPGEILSSEQESPIDDQIRLHARTIVQYRNLHRSVIAEIRRRRTLGTLQPKSSVLLLNDARVYRQMMASHKRSLDVALARVAFAECDEATCTECRMEVA